MQKTQVTRVADPELRMEGMETQSLACFFQEQSVGGCFPLSFKDLMIRKIPDF